MSLYSSKDQYFICSFLFSLIKIFHCFTIMSIDLFKIFNIYFLWVFIPGSIAYFHNLDEYFCANSETINIVIFIAQDKICLGYM